MKKLLVAAAAVLTLALAGTAAAALEPFTFDPGNACPGVTSTFNGGVLHLFSNMLFLWVFGDNIEDALGHLKFLIFYLLCGVAGGLAHAALMSSSQLPLIGASGAVSGVIAAYLMLHPRVRVWVLAFRILPLRVPAAWVLGFWVVSQFVMAVLAPTDEVAWWAHIGGMTAGAILVLFMRRPGVMLFDRGLVAPP